MSTYPELGWLLETIDMAEEGDLQAIGWLAHCHPIGEEREMWKSIYCGELSLLELCGL